jgi:hypothetical protein
MGNLTAFQKHCLATAQAFVQTAIIIDNDAALGADPVQSIPKQAVRSSGSIFAGLPGNSSVMVKPPLQDDVQGPGEMLSALTPAIRNAKSREDVDAEETAVDSGPLNVKALTDAFGNLSVICGIYRPENGSLLVDAFTAAAGHADILIVDWYLEPGSSAAAKEIALRVLRKDESESGRLRLIAIYTSQPNLRRLAEELLGHLQANQVGGQFSLSPEGAVIVGSSTRICFYNKAESDRTGDEEVVEAAVSFPSERVAHKRTGFGLSSGCG